MRYIFTIIWALLIGGVVSYVLSSMAGDSFNVNNSLIISAIIAIVIFVLGDGILKGGKAQ